MKKRHRSRQAEQQDHDFITDRAAHREEREERARKRASAPYHAAAGGSRLWCSRIEGCKPCQRAYQERRNHSDRVVLRTCRNRSSEQVIGDEDAGDTKQQRSSRCIQC